LPLNYRDSLKKQLQIIIVMKPPYKWGGLDPVNGIDCSGYVFLAFKRAGIPGVTRTTSVRMAQGLGGWKGADVSWLDAEECDLIFWSFKPDRPNGHVGVLMLVAPAWVTHSGTSKGVGPAALQGCFLEKISKIRRITIGD
jgi:hypothetical protein